MCHHSGCCTGSLSFVLMEYKYISAKPKQDCAVCFLKKYGYHLGSKLPKLSYRNYFPLSEFM